MSISEQKAKFNIFRQLPFLIVLIGIALAIIQLLFNRSLWNDEASLALNIINKSYFELTKPLDYLQVAPILFLQVEKIFSSILPRSEIGLRLFPFLCYCISIILFYKVVVKLFQNHFVRVLAVSLFVFNVSLIVYSNQVKQYICDVLVLNALLFLCIKTFNNVKLKFFLLGLTGVLSIFISNASIMILFSAGIYLLIEYMVRSRIYIKPVLLVFSTWLAAFLIYYFLFINGHKSIDMQQDNFTKLNGFMPKNILSYEFYHFFLKKVQMIFMKLIAKNYLIPILFIVGIGVLLFKNKFYLMIGILPIFVHLIISSFKLYPFDLRLILYSLPIFILIIAYGMDFILGKIGYNINSNFSIIIPLLLSFLFFKNRFPFKIEEVKSSINYVQKEIKSDEKIFIYYGANRITHYYQAIGLMKTNHEIKKGEHSYRNEKEKYLIELDSLKGKYWIIFGHVHGDEESYILKALKLRNIKAINSYTNVGSSAYLFNFDEKVKI